MDMDDLHHLFDTCVDGDLLDEAREVCIVKFCGFVEVELC